MEPADRMVPAVGWNLLRHGDPTIQIRGDGRRVRLHQYVCPVGCSEDEARETFIAEVGLSEPIVDVTVVAYLSWARVVFLRTESGRLLVLEPEESFVLSYDAPLLPRDWALREVELGGPPGRPIEKNGLICAPTLGSGVACWEWCRSSSRGFECRRASDRHARFEGGPSDVVALTEDHLLDSTGQLWQWRPSLSEAGVSASGVIEAELRESEVHDIVSRRLAGTCFVYGAGRELRCYQDATLPSYTGLRDVTSIGEGAHHVCAVASRGGHRSPWLYCWGLAAATRGSPDWLNLGPHGLDLATMSPLPADALGLVFPTPRPVVPVPAGTRVDLRGFVTCVQTPDGRTLCDSPVGSASEPLPRATRDARAIQCPADVPAGFEPECERFDH